LARVFSILFLSIFFTQSVWAGETSVLGHENLQSPVVVNANLNSPTKGKSELQPSFKLESTARLADRAEKLRIANNSAQALPAFQELVRRQPKNSRYRAGLGNVYCQLNRLEEAKQEFDHAISLNPKNVEVHKFLALYYIRRQDMKSARLEYKKLLALDPRHNCKCGGIQRLLGIEKGKPKPVRKAAK
jgi:Flp pilus assembly protein TadD